MPTMDQIVWEKANVTAGGETKPFKRGALLPEPSSAEEAAERSLLRVGGAIRSVEVVYTAEELAAQVQAGAEAGAARAVQHDVDPSLPAGDQLPGTAQPGPPVLEAPGATPVVIGPDDSSPARPAPKTAPSGAAKDTAKGSTGGKN